MRRVFFVKLLAALAVTLLMAENAWADQAAVAVDDPKTVVENTVNGIIKVLEAREDSTTLTEADREKIRNVVTGRFDYREMSQRSLGKEWRDISEADKQHFTELFRRLLERSYGNRLASFSGQKVTFDDAQFKNDKARVITSVVDVDKKTPVEYRLHQTKTGWQVYDIKIEGVSLVSNFRKDFQEGINQNGGFDGLVKVLEKKLESLESKDNA